MGHFCPTSAAESQIFTKRQEIILEHSGKCFKVYFPGHPSLILGFRQWALFVSYFFCIGARK